MDPTSRRPDRALVVIAAIVVVLIVVALVAVLTRDHRAELDPASPEGVVQQYTGTMIDADLESARTLVADSALEECDYYSEHQRDRETRVTLEGSTVSGSTAIVRVGISSGYDGGVFGSSYVSHDQFTLDRVDGQWLVTGAPWQFDPCGLRGVQ
ncbi:MAG: hypothetical protein IR160_13115 [Salinibacterium sp.]|nr:hypothetical protein [Salinibacterium sp.]MBF0673515.1 hypothetical protein [Salinibacterium sp.]